MCGGGVAAGTSSNRALARVLGSEEREEGMNNDRGQVVMRCVFCGQPAEGNYSIHRDGFGIGPEVPLCDECGCGQYPTLEVIWAHVAAQRTREEKKARKK